jgi:hypothetical protein
MLDPVVSGTDQDVPNHKQSSLFQQRWCNTYLINDLGGWWKEQNHEMSIESMLWVQ